VWLTLLGGDAYCLVKRPAQLALELELKAASLKRAHGSADIDRCFWLAAIFATKVFGDAGGDLVEQFRSAGSTIDAVAGQQASLPRWRLLELTLICGASACFAASSRPNSPALIVGRWT
jgi:hypothetical protein